MRLCLENLEDRRALAAYTVQVLDPNNLVSPELEGKMLANLDFAMKNMSNFVDWKGVLDAQIRIRPTRADFPTGLLTALESTMPGNRNAAIYEMTTGIDPYPNEPDCGVNVWMAKDGTVKVYGMEMYYDPAPSSYLPSNVPSGVDFVGALTHEIFHSIGVRETVEFNRHLKNIGGNTYFVGPNTLATLGKPLPYVIGSGHYGNTSLPDNPIGSGLMFQWANIDKNRLDIGKLDLAILKDVGLTIKSTLGLPLVDRIDGQMPKTVLTVSNVDENVALWTKVGIVSTAGAGFWFSLPEGLRDNRSFRILGNTLVTDSLIDYEKKSSYTLEVRNVAPDGVWTHTVITVGVRDMDDTPRIVAPSRATMVKNTVSLGCVGLAGDSSQAVSMAIFSRRGVITSTIRDPAVKVYVVRNASGGTTAFLVGSILAINRNTRFLSYSGDDSKLVVDIAATIGGVARNYGKWDIELARLALLPGRFSSLRV